MYLNSTPSPPSAGSYVRIQSAQNPSANLCLGVVTNSAQSEILLEPCTRNLTTFILPSGAPSTTQIELAGSATPQLCITAAQSLSENTPVIL